MSYLERAREGVKRERVGGLAGGSAGRHIYGPG